MSKKQLNKNAKTPISIENEVTKTTSFFDDIFEVNHAYDYTQEKVIPYYTVWDHFPFSFFPSVNRIYEVLQKQDKFLVIDDITNNVYVVRKIND